MSTDLVVFMDVLSAHSQGNGTSIKSSRLALFREIETVLWESYETNEYIPVDRIQTFIMLRHMVHIVTIVV
jgi:hypothetical protein